MNTPITVYCAHNMVLMDSPLEHIGGRSLWKCSRCGKIGFDDEVNRIEPQPKEIKGFSPYAGVVFLYVRLFGESVDSVNPLNKAAMIRRLAGVIITQKYLLNPTEINFIEKRLGVTSERMAGLIGVHIDEYLKWSCGEETICPTADRLLRVLLIAELRDEACNWELELPNTLELLRSLIGITASETRPILRLFIGEMKI